MREMTLFICDCGRSKRFDKNYKRWAWITIPTMLVIKHISRWKVDRINFKKEKCEFCQGEEGKDEQKRTDLSVPEISLFHFGQESD